MIKNLFFDTDCMSAFLWVNDTSILELLYGGRIVIPDRVYDEFSHPSVPHLKSRLDLLLSRGMAVKMNIELTTQEYTIYRRLTSVNKGVKAIGKGEASAIALAKCHNGIIASNNYKDIAMYVKEYGIEHIDTGMILIEALNKGVITEEQGNDIWKRMLKYNRKLPSKTFSE